MPSIIAKVMPVAAHLDELLDERCAAARRSENGARSCRSCRGAPPMRWMNTSSRLVSRRRRRVTPVPRATWAQRGLERRRIGADRHAARRRRARPARRRARRAARSATRVEPGAGRRRRSMRPERGDHLGDGAVGEQPAVGDVVDAVAALGLVHVVGRDQHGHARGGEAVDLVPELAPRLRIDAGGRLVEQQQLRLVHDAGGERQPLLPAAGQLAGELVAAGGEAERVERLARRVRARSARR